MAVCAECRVAQVVEGMHIVSNMEDCGSASGKPTKTVEIIKCGAGKAPKIATATEEMTQPAEEPKQGGSRYSAADTQQQILSSRYSTADPRCLAHLMCVRAAVVSTQEFLKEAGGEGWCYQDLKRKKQAAALYAASGSHSGATGSLCAPAALSMERPSPTKPESLAGSWRCGILL